MPNTANAQLLENRGKLKTMKGEGRGFLHFLKGKKIKSADPAGSFSGKKGKVKYSPSPKPVKKSNPKYGEPSGVLDFSNEVPSPRYSPPNDKRFKGKKNKTKSISGSMNWFGSDGRKSYFNPSISGFQGEQRRPNQRGSKLFFKELSRIQSKVIVKSTPVQNATLNSHRFQGFDKGRNRKGSKLYFRELSRERSKVLISAVPFENATRNTHKWKGLDKGKNRLGEKLYYREVSRDLSGVVINYNKPAVFTDTHKFKGLSRDRSRWGEWWFQWESSRAQARYEGTQQTISYADKMKYADKMAGKMAGYTGGFKTPKRNNKMHPSASYVYGKRARSQSQKEMFRKLNVVWVRVNRNKVQPDSVKDKPEKLKFDKKEKDLWNY